MLLSLSLRDFVIVDALDLDFSSGFTVLTGETGAGKSILIDALGFILGARADADVVREGATKADLTATFRVTEPLRVWLEDHALSGEGNEVLLRRTIDAAGRSRGWVNGVPVTAAQLKEAGAMLVDIHGQHAHQSLMQPAGQLTLLDAYAGHDELLTRMREAHAAWRDAKALWEEAVADAQKRAERTERLVWMSEELGDLDPKPGEWELLNAEHSRLAHAASIREGLSEAMERLSTGADELGSAMSRIESLVRWDESLNVLVETVGAAQDLLREASHETERVLDRDDVDEGRFEAVDRRVGRFFDLSRKFRVEPERLAALRDRVGRELLQLDQTADADALKAKAEEAGKRCREAAEELTSSRRKRAEALSSAVTDEMQGLAMKGGAFRVDFESAPLGAHGADAVTFMVAGHAGVGLRALQKTASGGELARISLAVAVITARVTPVPTLIFDEVDTGIGGATAEVVGRLLRRLSEDRQVLCVTHLPQVAACGKQHYRISKVTKDGVTTSAVHPLSEDERTKEIARMMAGSVHSKVILDGAEEMLRMGRTGPENKNDQS